MVGAPAAAFLNEPIGMCGSKWESPTMGAPFCFSRYLFGYSLDGNQKETTF